ncbi:NAD-P-binding protein [Infundibulicybe gibba]|nr:NAD-P-binding protein [Infundibulicybe gibba]
MAWLLSIAAPAFAVFVALALYIRLHDSRLKRQPPSVLALSPTRWTPDEIKTTAVKLAKSPKSVLDQLPPKTGRRYIIVGGGGFVGGWIVSQLLERGEDVRRMRILDLRAPTREELVTGRGKDIPFFKVDITDLDSLESAFNAPWPVSGPPGAPDPPLTVFHTAANIRFYERHASLLSKSAIVNITGTQNIIRAARAAGAETLVYTSSGSVALHRTRMWLWPWEREPEGMVQVLNDDDSRLPKHHSEFFSNYAYSKLQAERLVRAADKAPTAKGALRTGCIRPGNGVFGPHGDALVGFYLMRGENPSWISSIIQSFSYVENCAAAHILYEQRLNELAAGGTNPDIGGQAFMITDPGPTPSYGDVYDLLTLLTDGKCRFPKLSPTIMLAISHVIEWYYLSRHLLISAGFSLARMLPQVEGDIVNLQPSLFSLTMPHLFFDDSRARLTPAKGGLGYIGTFTTIEGCIKTVEAHKSGASKSDRGANFKFGLSKAQAGVGEVGSKVANRTGVDPVQLLSKVS